MSLLGFILADLAIGAILQEQENTREEIEKMIKRLEELKDDSSSSVSS